MIPHDCVIVWFRKQGYLMTDTYQSCIDQIWWCVQHWHHTKVKSWGNKEIFTWRPYLLCAVWWRKETTFAWNAKVTESTRQSFVVFIADQQLYKIALPILWHNQEMFENFYLRLGMHLLMSYIGSMSLMASSGLENARWSAFGCVTEMLTWKRFPENVSALRVLTEEILR